MRLKSKFRCKLKDRTFNPLVQMYTIASNEVNSRDLKIDDNFSCKFMKYEIELEEI